MEPSIPLTDIGSTGNQQNLENTNNQLMVNENPIINEEEPLNPNIQLTTPQNQLLQQEFAPFTGVIENEGDAEDLIRQCCSYGERFKASNHMVIFPSKVSTVLISCQRLQSFTHSQRELRGVVPLNIFEVGSNNLLVKLDPEKIQQVIRNTTQGPVSELLMLKILQATLDMTYTQLKKGLKTKTDLMSFQRGYRAAVASLQKMEFDPALATGLSDEERSQLNREYVRWNKEMEVKLEIIDYHITEETSMIANENANRIWGWSFTSPVVSIILFLVGIGVYWWLNRSNQKE